MQRIAWWTFACAALLPGVLLLPIWPLGGLGAGEDELLYYLPNRTLLRQVLLDGWWPWLNVYNGLDRPLLADPQTAVFYPGTWLFLLMPVATAYGVNLWLHYSLAWLGCERLLRGMVDSEVARCFGATAFAFGGFLVAHKTHLTMLQASAWLPWVLWALLRYVQQGQRTGLLVAGGCAALQCLAGHVQIAGLTALGSLVLVLGQTNAIRRWLLTWSTAAGLFAIQAVPTAAFVQFCTRTERGYSDFIENFWHPLSAVGLLFPFFLGQRTLNLFAVPYWGPSHQVEQLVYPGVLVVLLVLLGWRLRQQPNLVRWWLLLGLSFAIATSLLCPLLFFLPGASLFRVPARALVLGQLAASVIAAVVLDAWDERRSPVLSQLRAAGLALGRRPLLLAVDLGLLVIIAGLLAYPWLSPSAAARCAAAIRPWNPALLAPVALIAGSLWGVGWVLRGWDRPRRRWLLVAILMVDLGVVGWSVDVPPGWQTQSSWLASVEREIWRDRVAQTNERLWVVTTRGPNGLPGEYIHPLDRGSANTNLLDNLQTLTDYGPLQPSNYAETFGFEPWGESKNPTPLFADPDLLARCNVGWVLLCGDDLLGPLGSQPILATPNGLRLYRQPNARGRAFLDDSSVAASVYAEDLGPNAMRIRVDSWVPLSSDAPVTLVISRLAQPGWRAFSNGEEIPIESVDGLLLGVQIPRGELVEVTLRYSPPGLQTGATISLVTLLLLLVWAYWPLARGQ